MMHTISQVIPAAIVWFCVAAAVAPVQAQDARNYPTRPIRLVVAFTAGGTPDTLARMLGPRMSENWKQPVIVENRPGAGGTIAATMVAKAPSDGYTLLVTSNSFAITAALQPNLSYDTLKDFAGVARIGHSTGVLVAAPTLGVKSAKELIALAQTQPGKLLYGSAGAGSGTHMGAEIFKLSAGIKAQHVAFKGQPEFLIEIAAGRVHFGVAGLGPALPLITDGKLLPLAVVSPKRSPVLPEVPASTEVLSSWPRVGYQAVYAPAGTPRAVLARLNDEILRILALPDIRQRLESYDFQLVPGTADELDKSLRADIEVYTRIARDAGLRPK